MKPSEVSEVRVMATEMRCIECACRIQPRQLYLPRGRAKMGGITLIGPRHVACPTEHEIAHAARMGRPL